MSFSLRSSVLGKWYFQKLQKSLLPWFTERQVTPMQLTLWGAVMAALVPFGFYCHPALGLALILTSGLADSLDGLVARHRKLVSAYGAFLDSSLDRWSDLCFLLGFWVLFWEKTGFLPATALFFMSELFTLMISYVKARSEALGITCNVGLLERGARVLYLVGWALLITVLPQTRPALLWGGLILYTGLSFFTVLQRILHVRKSMRKRPQNDL